MSTTLPSVAWGSRESRAGGASFTVAAARASMAELAAWDFSCDGATAIAMRIASAASPMLRIARSGNGMSAYPPRASRVSLSVRALLMAVSLVDEGDCECGNGEDVVVDRDEAGERPDDDRHEDRR